VSAPHRLAERAGVLETLGVARPARERLARASLLGAGAIGASVALMGTSAWLISRAAQHPSEASLTLAIVGVQFFGLSRGFFRYGERLVGHDADARRLEELAARTLDAWRAEFIGPDGALTPDSQANHVRALAWDLVPDELRVQTASRLVELVRAAETHLGTGFLATPYLLPVLADAGHLNVAFELLFQDTPPSWLAMVVRGATTVWELWEGVDDEGVAHESLNHYSKGAVISFLHRYVAGIDLLDDGPAYRRFRVQPRPGGGLTWAEAVHDSPLGRLESSWRIDGRRLRLIVTVPPGAAADVVLPDGAAARQGPGTREYESGLG